MHLPESGNLVGCITFSIPAKKYENRATETKKKGAQRHSRGEQLLRLVNSVAVDVDAVRQLLPHCMPAALSESLNAAADHGHLEVVNEIAGAIRPGSSHVTALGCAAQAGHMDVVRALLPLAKALSETGAVSQKSICEVLNAAASRGHLNVVREIVAHESLPFCLWEALRWAARGGRLEVVQELLSLRGPSSDNSDALRGAAMFGHLDIVHVLIPFSDPEEEDSKALRLAAGNGHLEVVRLLLPLSHPKADDSDALRQAAKNGHLEVVRELLPVCDARARDSEALRSAAASGHSEVVRLLIPASQPKALESEALQVAVTRGYRSIARLLAPVSDVSVVLEAQLKSLLTFHNGTAPVSSFDEVIWILDDSEREKAYTGLIDGLLALMPNLSAWHAARELKSALHEATPRATPASSHRRSL